MGKLSVELQEAYDFAKKAHKGQKYGTEDYFEGHVVKVFEEALYETDDLDMLCASLLHDVVEDTMVELYHIKEKFGIKTSNIVYLLTDPAADNRSEKKAALYRLYSNAEGEAIFAAALVKTADRLVNHRKTLEEKNIKKASMYVAEFKYFVGYIAHYVADYEIYVELWNTYDSMKKMVEHSL